jgi:hypothetical protein
MKKCCNGKSNKPCVVWLGQVEVHPKRQIFGAVVQEEFARIMEKKLKSLLYTAKLRV